MATRLRRSISEPIREGLNWRETWLGPDNGLIWCWERGRQKRTELPELAERANRGELVGLEWKGGVTEKLKVDKKPGTLQYLAAWQGIRGEDLDIDPDGEHTLLCSRTGQVVVCSGKLTPDED
ncbi:MAG: hypothetical protein M1274_11990 [Actinobacteria bacterium]|nr:hypothetical protein [Actinomycetota bacterium]